MKTTLKSLLITLLLIITVVIQFNAQTQNYLTTSGNKLFDSTGKEVRLTGVNWFGFETALYSPHGIWSRDLKSVLQQIKDLGFNTIRVPWCNEMLDPGSSVNVNSYGTDPYSGVSPMNEEETTVSTPIELLDIFVDWCQENDMKIVLDNHSRAADGFLNEAFWYTPEYSEERWINDWIFMAERYKGKSAVVAMDLNNEPHGSTWGNSNPATDWNKAAERCGNAVLAVNPDVLIIIEGVGEFEGDSYWWGGQLKGAEQYPIQLSNQEKLMYSAHEYGPEVAQQDWFEASNFPNNMPGLWEEHFHFLYENNSSPIFIGEFGIKNQDAFNGIAFTWFTEFMDFMGDIYSWTFWTMNPNSGDTGGILQDDWLSVNQWKMDVLSPHFAPLIPNVINGTPPTNRAPIASFSGSITIPCVNVNPNESFGNFDASNSSDPDGDSLTYTWDFGDGSTGSGINVSNTYSSIDTVDVTLTVSDGELSDSITQQFQALALPCAPPSIESINIEASTITGVAPLEVSFEAIAIAFNIPPSSIIYSWDFDNGNSDNGPVVSSIFSNPGTYNVEVNASSNNSQASQSITITVTDPTPSESELSLNYRNGVDNATDNAINPHFEIVNNGTNTVAYSDLAIRYWFTSEDNNDLNFWCDWAQLGTGNVQGTFGTANGMDYLEITFDASAGNLNANSDSGDIQTRFSKTNWSNFNENDDYSYDPNKTSYTAHDKVTLYQNGNLVWGDEPTSTGAKLINEASFTIYPNPASEQINIQNNIELTNSVITIYDLSGKQVKSSTGSTIPPNSSMNISDLNSGIYIIEISTADKKQTKVFAVE